MPIQCCNRHLLLEFHQPLIRLSSRCNQYPFMFSTSFFYSSSWLLQEQHIYLLFSEGTPSSCSKLTHNFAETAPAAQPTTHSFGEAGWSDCSLQFSSACWCIIKQSPRSYWCVTLMNIANPRADILKTAVHLRRSDQDAARPFTTIMADCFIYHSLMKTLFSDSKAVGLVSSTVVPILGCWHPFFRSFLTSYFPSNYSSTDACK